MEKYQEKFFPNLPIVFFAINDIPYAKKMAAHENMTGFIEATYIKSTINVAKNY